MAPKKNQFQKRRSTYKLKTTLTNDEKRIVQSNESAKTGSLSTNVNYGNVKGLENKGNFCYFNSVIQILLNSPNFIDELEKYCTESQILFCKFSGVNYTFVLKTSTVSNVEKALISLYKEPGNFSTTKGLWSALAKYPSFSRFCTPSQRDSFDVFRTVLSIINEAQIKRIKTSVDNYFNDKSKGETLSIEEVALKSSISKQLESQTFIGEYFRCHMGMFYTCKSCHEHRCIPHSYFHISVYLNDIGNIQKEDSDDERDLNKSSNEVIECNDSEETDCNEDDDDDDDEYYSDDENDYNLTSDISKEAKISLLSYYKSRGLATQCNTAKTDLELALERISTPRLFKAGLECKSNKCAMQKITAQYHQQLVFRAPRILPIRIDRIKINKNKKSSCITKISTVISFPTTLNLAEQCSKLVISPSKSGSRSVTYKLYAVIKHIGNQANSGHYVAYINASCINSFPVNSKNPMNIRKHITRKAHSRMSTQRLSDTDKEDLENNNNDDWLLLDDSSVSKVPLKTVLKQQAIMLFYYRSS